MSDIHMTTAQQKELYLGVNALLEIIKNERTYNAQLTQFLATQTTYIQGELKPQVIHSMERAKKASDEAVSIMDAMEKKIKETAPELSTLLERYNNAVKIVDANTLSLNKYIDEELPEAIKKANAKLNLGRIATQDLTLDIVHTMEELIKDNCKNDKKKNEALKRAAELKEQLLIQQETRPQIATVMVKFTPHLPGFMNRLKQNMGKYFQETIPALEVFRLTSTNYVEQLFGWQKAAATAGGDPMRLSGNLAAPAQRPLRVAMPIEELYKRLNAAGLLATAEAKPVATAIGNAVQEFKKIAMKLNMDFMADDMCLFNGKKEYTISKYYPDYNFNSLSTTLKNKIAWIKTEIEKCQGDLLETTDIVNATSLKNKITKLEVQLNLLSSTNPKQLATEFARLKALNLVPETIERKIEDFLQALGQVRKYEILLDNTPKSAAQEHLKLQGELQKARLILNLHAAAFSEDEKKLIGLYGKFGIGDLLIIERMVQQKSTVSIHKLIQEQFKKQQEGFDTIKQQKQQTICSAQTFSIHITNAPIPAKVPSPFRIKTRRDGGFDVTLDKKHIAKTVSNNIQALVGTAIQEAAKINISNFNPTLEKIAVKTRVNNFKSVLETQLTAKFPGCQISIAHRDSNKTMLKILIKDNSTGKVIYKGKQIDNTLTFQTIAATDPSGKYLALNNNFALINTIVQGYRQMVPKTATQKITKGISILDLVDLTEYMEKAQALLDKITPAKGWSSTMQANQQANSFSKLAPIKELSKLSARPLPTPPSQHPGYPKPPQSPKPNNTTPPS